MGWLSNLLLLPMTAPVNVLVFVSKQIKEQIDAEQLDEGLIEAELVELSLRYDLGEVPEANFLDQETALLKRLNAIRVYKESLTAGSKR